MHFGFSYVGLVYLLMLFVPNVIAVIILGIGHIGIHMCHVAEIKKERERICQ